MVFSLLRSFSSMILLETPDSWPWGTSTTYRPGSEIREVTLAPLFFLAVLVTWTRSSWFGWRLSPRASFRYRKAFLPSPRLTKDAWMPGRTLSTRAL